VYVCVRGESKRPIVQLRAPRWVPRRTHNAHNFPLIEEEIFNKLSTTAAYASPGQAEIDHSSLYTETQWKGRGAEWENTNLNLYASVCDV
jgi:hypothetical protein